jgi:DNA-binding XRE family transcriptional regulator
MSRQPSRDRISLEREPHPVGAAAEDTVARARRLLAERGGHQLAEIRKRLGLTQREIAEVLGVSISRISQIEHGATSFDGIVRYIEALGGRLDLVAHFGDSIVHLSVSDASAAAA